VKMEEKPKRCPKTKELAPHLRGWPHSDDPKDTEKQAWPKNSQLWYEVSEGPK
jgi:hypothetical protein